MRMVRLGAAILAATASVPAMAGQFINGNFETGDLTGWTPGGGRWTGGSYPSPNDYLPGGSRYNPGGYAVTGVVTGSGMDPLTGNNVRMVYSGRASAVVNDSVNNYGVSVISQRVNNYTDPRIAFAFRAVLEDSHGANDSDAFIIQLLDATAGDTVFSYNLNSATAPGLFQRNGIWYYSDWLTQDIDVSGRSGHDFILSLLANDCPYGGHAGLAYLDGFGAVVPPPNGGVPEPATWGMMILGMGVVGSALRRRRLLAVA